MLMFTTITKSKKLRPLAVDTSKQKKNHGQGCQDDAREWTSAANAVKGFERPCLLKFSFDKALTTLGHDVAFYLLQAFRAFSPVGVEDCQHPNGACIICGFQYCPHCALQWQPQALAITGSPRDDLNTRRC